jgi:LysM repeat protein
MKKTNWLLTLCLLAVFSWDAIAKQDSGKASNPLKSYTVKNGDTWYSIARSMDISFSELRLANKSADKVLQVGQVISIPAKAKPGDPRFEKNHTNTVSETKVSAAASHQVEKGETVYSISKKYGITTDQLITWNNIKGNTIAVGQLLKVKNEKNQSLEKAEQPTIESEVKTEKASKSTGDLEAPSKSTVKNEKPLSGYVFSGNRQQVTEQGTATSIVDEEVNPGKYYALHRSAPVGTIIKVTNRMNEKSVFVKVVGALPTTGDNEGLIIKISKSGADKLGALDERFQVELIYGIPSK